MDLNPYLVFNGQCETAFKLYEECLGGKIEAMERYGKSPMADMVPVGIHNAVMHARLSVGTKVLMGCDATPDQPYEGIKGCSVLIDLETPAEAERVFTTLAQDGRETMPMQETFWASRFGMLVDRFGVPWIVNCDKPR